MLRYLLTACILTLLAAYNNARTAKAPFERVDPTPSSQFGNIDTLAKFGIFISKFKLMSYPLTASTTCYEPDSSTSLPLDMDNDSMFINYVGPAATVGLLPDTSDFYAVIYCTAAECYLPQLAVFSKRGKLLSSQAISFGCGSDVGYFCTEVLTVNSLRDITLVHNEIQYEVDKRGRVTKHIQTKTNNVYKYSITKNGLITVNQ